MAKKSGKQTALDDEQSQPLLEDDSRETEMIPVDEAELEPELAEDDDAAQRKPKKLADEPLFAALLRRAVKKHWGDDGTLLDFCDCVAGPLSAQLGHVGAKGGKFAAELAQAGKDVERFSRDQSLRAHLINGLFPVLRIARRLKGWGAPQFRRYDARAERVFMASYLLHDWVKLPSAQRAMQAAGLNHDTVNPAKDLQFMRQTFTNLCAELGIDKFLQPVGGVGEVLEDLIAIASNTQLRWGTNRNPSAFPNLVLDGPTRDLCEQLSRMADYITYLARTPREVARHDGLHQTLVQLSDGKARLVSHHVTEVRGILTNLIHNAAMEAMTNKCREPLLFAPSGVVYFEWEGAPPLPEIEQIAEDTIETIKRTSKKQIIRYGVGTSFDNKGIKFADYYKEILNFDEYVKVTCEIVSLRIKNSHVKDRYKSMIKKAFVSAAELCDMPEDVQVDSLAAWFRTCSMNLVDTISEIDERLLSFLNFTDDIKRIFNRIPQSDGGMGLRWFFAAGQYRKCHPGLDPEAWRGQMAGIADALANAIGPVPLTQDDPWADTRDYIQRALHFVDGAAQAANLEQNVFLRELGNYTNAKCGGRGVSIASSVGSSPYESREQRETSVLFAPQVYTSRLPLHGSKAIRGIDPISAKEMMLRQLFMNRSNAIGGKFEGQKIRYLYFYPVYFFSLETMKVFDELYDRLQGLSLTELKRQLVNETATPPALKLDENT
ncbi:MAG: type I-D CRISPR-associated protein Cas10d/Csc3, partial [Anaerolineae bacterium]